MCLPGYHVRLMLEPRDRRVSEINKCPQCLSVKISLCVRVRLYACVRMRVDFLS